MRSAPERRPTLLVAGLLAVVVVLMTGCGGGGGSDATSATVRAVRYAYARDMFRRMCAGCHTLADAGAHGLQSNLDTALSAPDRRRAVRTVIVEGKGERMPAWRETFRGDTEIEALTRYVTAVAGKSTSSGDGRQATTLTPIAHPESPPEDPIDYGRVLFQEMCAGCHTLADAGAHEPGYDLDYNYATISAHERQIRAHRGVRGFPPFMPNWELWLPQDQLVILERYVQTVARKDS